MTTRTVETETVTYDAETGRMLGWGKPRPGQQVRTETVEHTVVTGTVTDVQYGTLTEQTVTLDDGTVYHVTGALPQVGQTITAREESIPSGLLLGRVRVH